jgi:hypothetical protein
MTKQIDSNEANNSAKTPATIDNLIRDKSIKPHAEIFTDK